MLITSGTLYIMFGDSTLQPWNSPNNRNNNNEELLDLRDRVLKKTKIEKYNQTSNNNINDQNKGQSITV